MQLVSSKKLNNFHLFRRIILVQSSRVYFVIPQHVDLCHNFKLQTDNLIKRFSGIFPWFHVVFWLLNVYLLRGWPMSELENI